MNTRVRLSLFFCAALALGGLLLWGVRGLPPVGVYSGQYGRILDRIAVPERHVTDVVSAVTFDYRGFDTVGEEFILFVAVAAVALLLRTERNESDVQPPADEAVDSHWATSDAVHALGIALIGPTVVLGLYIVSHGQLTPGGGFQGGVILASAILLAYLSGEYSTFRSLTGGERAEIADAVGAVGFVVIGLIGMVTGAAYLTNVLPLGPVGVLYSAGMIPLINLSVGLEVCAALLVILAEFLRQVLQVRASARLHASNDGGGKGSDHPPDLPQSSMEQQPEQSR